MSEAGKVSTGEPPGAARYGNFISYYNFHPPEERTKLLPFELLASFTQNGEDDSGPLTILDVGCNSGELTEQVHKLMEEISGRRCCTLAIDLDPTLITRARESSNPDSAISYEVVNVTTPQFPLSAAKFLQTFGKDKFDMAFLFSVTMWIHLNSGDEALETSLTNVANLSKMIVIEPQPWKCYKTAVRRMKRANALPFKMFDKLR